MSPSSHPSETGAGGSRAGAPPLLQRGQRFGSYAIARLLGRGGMGEVYEAEEVDSGRRVALKLLNRPLSTREERDRFLREGRLAAGVSHPHCVYVFGTDEIDGLPVISMELAAGGTLKDTVAARGPLPSREAVDAILQVIDGLEAAAAAGVLHRDIKPANCFVDVGGRVKVGDFGLSTSTLASDETHLTMAGTIMGTPAFASPEQMRADNLDVRSDIYSVGATLYYLLTSRAPFEESNIVRLVTMVMQDVPPAPSELRRDIPKGLSAAVLRALAKRPGDRFEDYAAMRAALEPFSSAAPVPARPGPRLLACLVDHVLIGILTFLLTSPFAVVRSSISTDFGAVVSGGAATRVQVLAPLVFWLVYWIVCEGFFGASLGKRLFRLRVARAGGEPASLGTVVVRTTIFMAIPLALGLAWLVPALRGPLTTVAFEKSGSMSVSVWLVPFLILFSSARSRNGHAGLHELATGTRVVAMRTTERAVASAGAATEPTVTGLTRMGPYSVLDDAAREPGAGVLRAWDERLRRPVWLHLVPTAFSLPAWRRDLSRPTRPRWLAGRRDEGSSWDAYEAAEGRPFLEAVKTPQPWAVVRGWVRDLAQELEAGLPECTLPVLGLDRLWVGSDRRIWLLDWPPPGARETGGSGHVTDEGAGAVAAELSAAERFLHLVATAALGRDAALPRGSAELLERLAAGRIAAEQGLAATVTAALSGPTEVSRSRRALHLVFAALPPVALSLLSWFMMAVLLPQLSSPDRPTLMTYVMELQELARIERKADTAENRALRESLEIDIAARFPGFLSGAAASSPATQSLPAELQAVAARIRAADRHPSPEEARRAREVAAPVLDKMASERQDLEAKLRTVLPAVALVLWAFVGAVAILSSLAARGGVVLRLLDLAVVDRRGREAVRWRCALRTLVAWLPVIAAAVLGVRRGPSLAGAVVLPLLVAFVVGAGYAVFRPGRGVQDWIAGTRLVPR